ncbi:MAG: restriction endonuclease subunit S [Lentilactobacillus hilgardii]|uniref:restriction endonuclease subunit S n=1 Tax=Lactobacillaceae TaxID=33958 RepID=UPI001CC1CC39|nr:restriction endonuclease subunit S [Lentilactobacillus hilgardii]MBZ2200539.1 hypothetical protein [Lentilactobacillus hilgardii]MBZ2204585.1 hypothetical protein [Lentilactobacillus hilgardii]
MAKQPKVRFKGDMHWQNIKLGDLFEKQLVNQSDTSKRKHGEANYVNRQIVYHSPLIESMDFPKVEIDEDADELQKGDVLFTSSSGKPTEIAKAAVIGFEPTHLYAGDFVYAFRPKVKFNPSFLTFVLNEKPDIRQAFADRAQKGTSLSNIKAKDILKVTIPFLDYNSQERVGKILKSLNADIHNLEANNDVLESYKKWAMQNLFI